ncbi:mechanosensitive ion channel family protein [Ensifer sp. 4252]|uniref:mechanosensitive ion channel family protein n=1 Tax=Ensifer sp. 4252 TaxID=3373915 RepID=UPI003D2310D9
MVGVSSLRGFLGPSARILAFLTVFLGLASASEAQSQSATPTAEPAKVQQLIELLDDPEVRQWLATKQPAAPAAAAPAATTPADAAPAAGIAARWTAEIRRHLTGITNAVPRIGPEFDAARGRLAGDMENLGSAPILKGFLFILLIGYGAEYALRYLLKRTLLSAALTGPARTMLVKVLPLLVFAIATTTVLAVADWPSRLEMTIAPLLVAWIGARLLITIASAVLSGGPVDVTDPSGRAGYLSLTAEDARFWRRSSVAIICTAAAIWGIGDAMQALSVAKDVRNLVAAVLGVIVLALAILTVLRRPAGATTGSRRVVGNILLVAFLVLLWVLWVVDLRVLFWIGLYVIGLPLLLRFTSAFAKTMLDTSADDDMRVMRNVLIERGARLVIIALAAGWLALVFRVNASMMVQDDAVNRIFRGVLAGVVILLTADLVWQLAKSLISLRVKHAAVETTDAAQRARNTRLLTLMPILRNFLAAFILVVAVLMVLSGLGVQIGPLIAGAGVFGVAIGFGSQTLVKDVISGIFYMTDDAFRIGEYIQSGSYKGTVESFSIRSVKLRHHRGPVFTVPFGSLGAVQNMSRDWVIDKFMINVSYEADIAKVKKVVKGIGAALLEDPELGPMIIETVKMKGVETFGDYGITLSFAMTTKPGHQTQIRRRAQAMIKEAFDKNGISFASPTVQVAGDEQNAAAAAATRDAIAKKNAAAALAENAPQE